MTSQAQLSSAVWSGKGYDHWRNAVQTALSSSSTNGVFKEKLRDTVVGNIDRRQLTQLCEDILATGLKTYSKGDDELEEGIKINTSKDDQGHEVISCEAERSKMECVPLAQTQSLLLDAFKWRLTNTRKFYDLEGWFKMLGEHKPSLEEQHRINVRVTETVWSLVSQAKTCKTLLEGMEREVDCLVKSERLDQDFQARVVGKLSWQPITDEQRELLKRGAEHLAFGDLPAFIKKEQDALRIAEASNAGWSLVEGAEASADSL